MIGFRKCLTNVAWGESWELMHIKPAIHLEGWLHGEFQGIPYIQMSLHEMKLIITWLKMIAKKMVSLLSEMQAWEISSHKGQLILEWNFSCQAEKRGLTYITMQYSVIEFSVNKKGSGNKKIFSLHVIWNYCVKLKSFSPLMRQKIFMLLHSSVQQWDWIWHTPACQWPLCVTGIKHFSWQTKWD